MATVATFLMILLGRLWDRQPPLLLHPLAILGKCKHYALMQLHFMYIHGTCLLMDLNFRGQKWLTLCAKIHMFLCKNKAIIFYRHEATKSYDGSKSYMEVWRV